MSYFVVLFVGRSGSSLIMDALDSHPEIEALGEILVDKMNQGQVAQEQRLIQFFEANHRAYSVRGFKTKLSDVLDPVGLRDRLVRSGCSVLWLERENLVKQALSWIRSDELHERYGVHNIRDVSKVLPQSTIDPTELKRRCHKLDVGKERLARFVETLGLPTLRIRYEDLLGAPGPTFNAILKFLGVAPQPLLSTLIKATPDDLRDAIANYVQIETLFRESDFRQWDFDENQAA